MKLPQTADDLRNEIFISSDKAVELGDLRIRQLIKLLDKVDDEIIVEGIIKVFEESRPDKLYKDQEFAGLVLHTISPKSRRDLKEILKRILPAWDKSVKYLPYWFLKNYGIEKVQEAFEVMGYAEIEKEKLVTMKFWIQSPH